MLRIGLTGGIGSGKSTVSKIFKTLGIPVYNADGEAKRFYLEDDVRVKIQDIFGTADLKEISRQAFSEPQKLRKLNAIIHPKVMDDFSRWADEWANKVSFVIMESAIIFENNLEKYFDKIIAVEAPEELRMQRTVARDNIPEDEIRKRMAAQMSEQERCSRADFIIINDNIQPLLPQISSLWSLLGVS
jgi:dephospho-CoA kinase